MKSKPIQLLLFLTFSVLFFSCDSEETVEQSEPPFFNLNVGNKWVYKRYQNTNENPTQFTFSGIVDTVKIVGAETIQGFTFAKKSSKKVNVFNGMVQSETLSYVRVNNAGHLIEIPEYYSEPITESSGIVLHPGNDTNFVYNRDVSFTNGISGITDVLGVISFHPLNLLDVTVEGVVYSVVPYNGVFTPSPNHPELISKTVEYNYAPAIGLVKSVEHTVSANSSWENRLISYEVN